MENCLKCDAIQNDFLRVCSNTAKINMFQSHTGKNAWLKYPTYLDGRLIIFIKNRIV